MTGSPTLSVVVPMHNCEQFIIRCLESLVNQSIKSIQIIVVDDASTDSSAERVNEFSQQYPMIELLELSQNGGPGAARNAGKQKARGEFIAFLDSDDWVDLSAYETTIATMQRDGSEMGVFGIKTEYTQPSDGEIRYSYSSHNCISGNYALKLFCRLHHTDTPISPLLGNKVFRRTPEFENDFFPESKNFEDDVFIFRCMLHMRKVSIVPDIYLYYFQHSASITHEIEKSDIESFVNLFVDLKQELSTKGLYMKVRDCYLGIFKYSLSFLFVQIRNNIKEEATQREYLLHLYESLQGMYSAKEIQALISIHDLFNLFPYKR